MLLVRVGLIAGISVRAETAGGVLRGLLVAHKGALETQFVATGECLKRRRKVGFGFVAKACVAVVGLHFREDAGRPSRSSSAAPLSALVARIR